MTGKLEALAQQKAREYAERPATVAVAVTGSVARGMTWAGSDVDLWVFVEGQAPFEDGVIDGIYWEADQVPAAWLDAWQDQEAWLQPPGLGERADRILEALWGCRVAYDPTGRLALLKQAVDARVADAAWLRRRAELFLAYGRGCLDALQYAPPLQAIVAARAVATDYGIAAYWMRQGCLLTSVCRIPELLEGAPRLQRLYCQVFGLRGRQGAEEFLRGYRELAPEIQRQTQSDLELEVLAVFERGCYDGGVRYMRQHLPQWHRPEEVSPALALEGDLEAQKERVLAQAREILSLCASAGAPSGL